MYFKCSHSVQCWPHSVHVQTVFSQSACLIKAHQLDLTTQVHSGGGRGGSKRQEEDETSNSRKLNSNGEDSTSVKLTIKYTSNRNLETRAEKKYSCTKLWFELSPGSRQKVVQNTANSCLIVR